MASGISWKEFESIVYRLQRTFNKAGTVTRDEKLRGNKSGRARQIDICIRTTNGTENVLMIVECKKWNRKVDVQGVEAFAGVKKDVGAQMGIMVSSVGFSKAAYQRAAGENISLYKYEDTLNETWPSGLETNILLEIWELTPTEACFILEDGTLEPLTTEEGLDFIDAKGNQPGGIASVLRKIWEETTVEEKRETTWIWDCACTTPERPEIKKLRLGAQSKFIRGIRKGRIHFEGLVNESKGHANVEAWKMVFDGEMRQWPKDRDLPSTESYSILLKSVFIKTENPKSRVLQGLIYNGVLELAVKGKDVMKLPVCSS
jgi:restriction endonuclease